MSVQIDMDMEILITEMLNWQTCIFLHSHEWKIFEKKKFHTLSKTNCFTSLTNIN